MSYPWHWKLGANDTATKEAGAHVISDVSVEPESRLETLEALIADALRVVRVTSLAIDRLSREMCDFEAEMSAFKEEAHNDRRAMNKC